MEIAILITLVSGVAVVLYHVEWSKPAKLVRPLTGLVSLLWPLLVMALLTDLLTPGTEGKCRKEAS